MYRACSVAVSTWKTSWEAQWSISEPNRWSENLDLGYQYFEIGTHLVHVSGLSF